MRLAVCLSGCLKAWKDGILITREKTLSKLVEWWGEEVNIHYFCSFWEFRPPSYNYPNYYQIVERYGLDSSEDPWRVGMQFVVPNSERNEFCHRLAPTDIRWYSKDVYLELEKSVWEKQLNKFNIPGFLMRESIRLKRKYEVVTGTMFDYILWTRPDVYIEPKVESVPRPESRKLYGQLEYSPSGEISFKDLFYFGSSELVDYVGTLYPGKIGDGCVERDFMVSLQEAWVPVVSVENWIHYPGISRAFEDELLTDNQNKEE